MVTAIVPPTGSNVAAFGSGGADGKEVDGVTFAVEPPALPVDCGKPIRMQAAPIATRLHTGPWEAVCTDSERPYSLWTAVPASIAPTPTGGHGFPDSGTA